jgi:hypothetical protein
MNKEQQRIAIAEACLGLEDFDWLLWCEDENNELWEGRKLHGAKRSDDNWTRIPDYLNDLNAMHEAENSLSHIEQCQFAEQLFRVMVGEHGVSEFMKIHATAAQRAEAFLKTIGKWE